MTHDLVVAGGHVLCPATGADGIADIAIDDGRIAAVGAGLTGRERVDAAGLLVVPGLIDLHVHVYDGVSHYGVDADTYLLRRGTTTGVDVGSAVITWRSRSGNLASAAVRVTLTASTPPRGLPGSTGKEVTMATLSRLGPPGGSRVLLWSADRISLGDIVEYKC